MSANIKSILRYSCIFLSFSTFANGCNEIAPAIPVPSDSLKGKRNNDSGKFNHTQADPASLETRLNGLKSDSLQLASDLTDINTKIAQIDATKEALCKRQSELMEACVVHTPLSPESWRSGAACKSERKAWEDRRYFVEVTGIQGRFQLILDNSVESNIFAANKQSKIEWRTRGNKSLKDLRLSDVGSIKLKAIDGNITSLNGLSFVLKIDDKIVLTEKDFVPESKTNNAVVISQIPLSVELSSSECQVNEAELESLIQSVQVNTGSIQTVTPPQTDQKESAQVTIKKMEQWIKTARNNLDSKNEAYLAFAQDIARIRRDLRGELQLGCWGREVIKTIEIAFNGSHLPLSDWDRSQAEKPLPPFGNPTQTTIDFGGNLRFTNGDEKTLALFRDGGRWSLIANTDLTIGDLSSFQIQKGGYAYHAEEKCWSTWGGLGKDCEWQNRESDRYHLNDLTIKINGELVYRKDALNISFERKNLKWLEKDFTSNPAYIDLMRRRDCPTSAALR
jgi:hypothetical protein